MNEWNSTAVAISLPLNRQQLTYGLDSIDKPARLDAVHEREDKTLGAMIKDDRLPHPPDFKENSSIMAIPLAPPPQPKLEWDWDIEHEDRRKEAKADAAMHGAAPFLVDRRVLKDVVTEKVGVDVGRISFLSSGESPGNRDTYPLLTISSFVRHISQGERCATPPQHFRMTNQLHDQAYLITLTDRSELVARVARRFMPRLKTESEVATMSYLRENTNIPVPTVYHYDSNPYNRLGGEYILMSKVSATRPCVLIMSCG